jgi:hypothetical protein
MNRFAGVIVLGAMLSAVGCITAEGRAESNRDLIRPGMTTGQVLAELGKPLATFPVPGQPDDPRLTVELWQYGYRYQFWSYIAMIFLFPFGFALVDRHLWIFDVGFGRDGTVVTVGKVTRK